MQGWCSLYSTMLRLIPQCDSSAPVRPGQPALSPGPSLCLQAHSSPHTLARAKPLPPYHSSSPVKILPILTCPPRGLQYEVFPDSV